MSVESAWDEALAEAGEALDSEMQHHLDRNRELLAEVERLKAENAALQRVFHNSNRANHRVDL